MKVKHKPAYRRERGRLVPQDSRVRVSVLTLEADEGEEECLLAWLRRALTEEGTDMRYLVGPDHLYEPPGRVPR